MTPRDNYKFDQLVAFTSMGADCAIRTYLGKVLYVSKRRVRIVYPVVDGRATPTAQESSVSTSKLRQATATDIERGQANGGLILEVFPKHSQALMGDRA